MKMKNNIEIKGLNKAIKKLHKITDQKAKKKMLRKTVNAAAGELAKTVRKNYPKREGVTKRMITHKVTASKDGYYGWVGADVKKLQADEKRPNNIDYLIEYGTSTSTGKYPITKAARQHKNKFIAAAKKKMQSEIEKHTK